MARILRPFALAFIISTIVTLILLALGIVTVTIPNGLFLLVALGILALIVIGVEVLKEMGVISCNHDPCCAQRYWFLNPRLIAALLLLLVVIIYANLLTLTVLVLPLILFWVLLFATLFLVFTILE